MKEKLVYTQAATSLHPALIIYLIDASHSMNDACNGATKIQIVNKALKAAIKDMVRRSIRDGIIQKRYKVAVFAYTTSVVDVVGGIRDLPELVKYGYPVISASGETNPAIGFAAVEALLQQHLVEFQDSPAPLVCHLTDALITAGDPTPIVRRIQHMGVRDGTVLVENVYVAEKMLRKPVLDWHSWEGVVRPGQLDNDSARLLFHLSSPLPETYRQNINNYGYRLHPDALLFFPGTHTDLVHLALVASTATEVM
ncbi:MAG TPA: vWA domain-containing protein [Ktedonobacteraceae bacterium]|nr:vWA domain-containing protein [Ktedonobacteraceae bacterium]